MAQIRPRRGGRGQNGWESVLRRNRCPRAPRAVLRASDGHRAAAGGLCSGHGLFLMRAATTSPVAGKGSIEVGDGFGWVVMSPMSLRGNTGTPAAPRRSRAASSPDLASTRVETIAGRMLAGGAARG